MKLLTATALACAVLAGPLAADELRLPPSVGATPIEIPRIARVAREGAFSYAALPDGTIYGDTNFGYARFQHMDDYRAFLRSH